MAVKFLPSILFFAIITGQTISALKQKGQGAAWETIQR
jgi:Na+/H+-dicarboxylate symporter